MSEHTGFVYSFLNADVIYRYYPAILEGMIITALLAVCIVISGTMLGLALAIIRSIGLRFVNMFIVILVDILRTVPGLVLIVLLYFGLPSVGFNPSGFAVVWLALTLVLMAFSEEIFWAGIIAVPKGQREAARSTGLSFIQTMRHVVLAQAVRMAVPPLTNRAIAITKGTSLGSVVGLADILGSAQSAMSFSSNPSPLTLGALAYLVLFMPLIALGRWIETRFAWKR